MHNKARFQIGVQGFGLALLLLGLSIYVYAGSLMRYSGDDYIYGSLLTQHGLFGGVSYAYMHELGFHGDRFALTFFMLLSSIPPAWVTGFLTGLAILVWAVSLMMIFRYLFAEMDNGQDGLIFALTSTFMVLITIYTAPDYIESVLWRSAMMTYLAPLVATLFLFWQILRISASERVNLLQVPFIFGCSFLAGGFSEIGVSILITYLIFWLLYCLLQYRARQRAKITALSIALGGAFAALAVMFCSPSVGREISESHFIMELLAVLPTIFFYANDFIRCSLRCYPLPNMVILLFAFCIAVLAGKRWIDEHAQTGWESFRIVICIALVAYVAIFASMSPGALIRHYFPNPRALILAKFIINLSLFMAAVVVFSYLLRFFPEGRLSFFSLQWMASVLLVGIAMYGLRGAASIRPDIDRFQVWAAQWDQRDHYIREQIAVGENEIHIPEIEKIIQWVGELHASQTGVNAWAAAYYDVDAIFADIPNQEWNWNSP